MRATKVVCTLGPATAGRVAELVRAGMDVARINCSHGTRADHDRLLGEVRRAADEAGRAVGVMADLSGPKVRLGELRGGQVTLEGGGRFELRPDGAAGDASGAPVSYGRLGEDLDRGDRILLADGAVELRVVEAGRTLLTEVVRGGTVRSRAGVNIPSERLAMPAITEKDRTDAAWALEAGVDLVAQSFVRGAADVIALRGLLGERPPLVVAKIETRPAVEDADAILAASDAAIVARGDLGVEASIEEIPVLEKDLVARAGRAGVPVIVATQMLESMVAAPRPTRAEASDVANAVFEGADAIMLSAETAIGRYPVEATATAGRIARVAETAGQRFLAEPLDRGGPPPSDPHAVARSAAEIARDGGAVAVACFTRTGQTAALLAAARPRVPIVALSTDEHVVRGLTLHRGVLPQACRAPLDTDDMIRTMDRRLREAGFARLGDATVLVASIPFGEARTNLLKLHRVGS
ncbi:MAG TPA: pyruvate kinase [Actinomycetota bacterium]|nr:pyruvate kinase [Actinomycetota bacterium]